MARLLVVEDDRDQLELRRLILERAGHQVWTAVSGGGALDALAEAAPSVVLMDLRLPRTEDGLALIRGLRARSPRARIVVLSGGTENFHGLAEGGMVDHHLQKPVRSQELLYLIEKIACDSIDAGTEERSKRRCTTA